MDRKRIINLILHTGLHSASRKAHRAGKKTV